jgi:alpha-glucosidase
LVQKAHEKGIRVLVDGVFNHCGAFHKWMDREGFYDGKGAYQDEKSPYRNYFYWEEDGSYEGWWGYANHPKLNIENCKELL